MKIETTRPDTTAEHRLICKQKYDRLEIQTNTLITSINQFIADINSGNKKYTVNYQFKMYNDESLNPALYKKKADSDPLVLQPAINSDHSISNLNVHSCEKVKEPIESIEDFPVTGQEKYLFDKVKSLSLKAHILKIGSCKGRLALAMRNACIGTDRKIYCIDTWKGNGADFMSNDYYQGLFDNIAKGKSATIPVPFRADSFEISNALSIEKNPVKYDFIFIDGSHKYEDVLNDFILSYSLLNTEGWIALHNVDETHVGPAKVWENIAKHILGSHEFCHTLFAGQKNHDFSKLLQIMQTKENFTVRPFST